MAVVTMRQLLESGVHFGHRTQRWNPKMKRFIFTERNGIYIIDLQQSLPYIDTAYEYIKDTVARGGTVLFVGTKKQAQEAISEQATRVGMPYVNQRWLGGMLTNFQTVHKRLQRLKELDVVDFEDVAASGLTKKELLQQQREHTKLQRSLGGLRDMSRVPNAIWVVDTKKEHIAVAEARKLGIPVIAILDTNCDPDEVDYKIPGNDDAIRSVTLLTRVVADAVADGLMARAGARDGGSGAGIGGDEPLADWERDLLQRQEAEAAVTPSAAEPVGSSASAGDPGTAEIPASESAATTDAPTSDVTATTDAPTLPEDAPTSDVTATTDAPTPPEDAPTSDVTPTDAPEPDPTVPGSPQDEATDPDVASIDPAVAVDADSQTQQLVADADTAPADPAARSSS